MRRTKEWWQTLTKYERRRLVKLEHSSSGPYGGGGYLPDDCSECNGCEQPQLGYGLCIHCLHEIGDIVTKANIAILEMEI